jgi:phosphoribosylglycinamide formyltransferase-1
MNLAVFCSGSGTNFQAIIDAVKSGYIRANISVMVCDNPNAPALKRAEDNGIDTLLVRRKDFSSREDFDREILRNLSKKKIDLVVLAGFMRLFSNCFIEAYRDRIINIHPSLLPSFKGAHAVKDALDYGVKITGATAHFVTEDLDSGPIILQSPVEVKGDDTEESLLNRVHEREHKIYIEAIKLFIEGKLSIKGRKVKINN